MKSWPLLLAALALIPTAAAKDPPEPVTLRVTTLSNPSAMTPESVSSSRVNARFLEKFPWIRLVSGQGINLDGAVSETTTIMMIAGDIAPDIIPMNFRSSDTFVRSGFVLPLDTLLTAESTEVRTNIQSRILPQISPVVHRAGPDGKTALYGLPTNFAVRGLFFNRELFRTAGLPQRAPRDWNELVAACEKLKTLGPRVRPLFLSSGPMASWDLITFIWSAGGEAVEEIAPGDWRATFNSESAVTAYEFYFRLVEADRLAFRGSAWPSAQEMNNVGMFFGSIGQSSTADPQLFGFGAMPKGPDGVRGAELNATIYGISSGITDERKRQAAWEYIKFLASDEADRITTETNVELGMAGRVTPTYLRRFGFDQYLSMVPRGLEEEFEEAMRTGKPEPYGRNCNLIYAEMTYPLDQILLSEKVSALWKKGERQAVRGEIKRILDNAVLRTNERMIGYVPPETMAFRRSVATAAVVAMLLLFLSLGWNVARQFMRSSGTGSQPVRSHKAVAVVCLAPALVLILVWKYLPLARGTVMAFQDYQLVLQSTFVGLDNFANVLFNPSLWRSLAATVRYAAWTLTLGFFAPILLAYALHIIPKHKIFFRVVYYLPAVISATAVFFLWRELFGVDGPLNQMLRMTGLEARRAWMEDPSLAMLSCVLPGVWAGVGPGCLIYLAALKTIPEEQFEAAELDGCGFFQNTFHIVLPSLLPLIAINFVGAVAASFHGATNILIMTGGGPNGTTEVTSLLIFYEAFTRLHFGSASAMAWILGSLLIGFTVFQLKRISRMEFKTAK